VVGEEGEKEREEGKVMEVGLEQEVWEEGRLVPEEEEVL